MNKKATLLIKNLEAIYTMDVHNGVDVIYHHACIAIHHDKILQISEKFDQTLMDKDTRIIDARGHFAIPAFIEAKGKITKNENYPLALQQYLNHSDYFKHGIVTIALSDQKKCYVETEIVPYREHASYPIVDARQIFCNRQKFTKKQFCISTYHEHTNIHDGLLLARLLYTTYALNEMILTKAMTRYPAKRLGLCKQGYLKKGMQADILLCKGKELYQLFDTFDYRGFDQIIKKGIRVYPSVIRS